MKKKPNLFIVGAPRCGTSSLHEYLKKIPGIFMSSVKEPVFFSSQPVPETDFIKPITSEKEYLKLFEKAKDEKILGESTTSYLADPEAPKMIKQYSPQAKIIAILRNPIERTFSHYMLNKRGGWTEKSFHEELDEQLKNKTYNQKFHMGLREGLYYEKVKLYFDVFKKENVKIIIFEEFIKNPKKCLEDILEFLNIKYHVENQDFGAYNVSSIQPRGILARKILKSTAKTKFPLRLIRPSITKFINKKILTKKTNDKIGFNDREKLIRFFSDDVKKLKNLLGTDLPWDDFSEKHN